ncbi:NB-ARC domain-containing protein [Methylovulum psychrotolerans]|uniref:NB-ARC domain-containing protein n=1 Tax=Methylovulum psychrotolerans TaxID=1704499 RepID=A0A1Z4BYK4_9GAMM|nr:tetratricopeptide repeat protein [Methylovulum psychrotolerans]ASF46323.1 hypothetical protein CEK71_09670 [Methylovulum psychrotolerans]
MEGQVHRGTGDNVGRDQTKIELQINQSAGSSYIGNQYLPPAEKPIPHHLTSTPFIPDVFQGRDADLAAIRATLEIGNKPLLLVNGEGGIGKTSLAAKYWQRYKDEYKHTAWLYAPSRLDDALLSLAKALKVTFPDTMPTEQRLEELQRAIANLPEFCLLIIDNANNAEELATQWGFLSKCSNCHILLTSRINSFDDAACYRVEALSEADALNVFKTHYKRHRIEDDELFGSIYQAVGGNTLMLVLLAKNLAAVNDNSVFYSLSQLLKDLQRQGLLRLSKTKPVQIMGKGSQPALETVDPTKIIAALYDELEQIKPLSENEQWLLCNLAVLPAENLAYGYLADLLLMERDEGTEEVFSDILSGLAKRGWLERSHQDGISHYKISPVVQDITRYKNLGRLQSYCAGLVYKLGEKLIFETNTGHLLNASYADAVNYCRYAETATALLPKDDNIGLLCGYIGSYQLTLGELDKSLSYFKNSYDIMAVLKCRKLNDIDCKSHLAVACQDLGIIYTTLGDLKQALRWHEERHSLGEEIHSAAPDHFSFKHDLAIACQYLGKTHSALGDLEQALRWYEEHHRLEQELYAAAPDHPMFKNQLAIACQYLGITYAALGDLEQALLWYEKHHSLEQELHATDPDHLGFKNQLAIACRYLGISHVTLGNLEQALRWNEDYYRLAQELHATDPDHLDFKDGLATACQYLGVTHATLGDPEKALRWYQDYHCLEQELHTVAPDHLGFKNGLAVACQWLGIIHTTLGDLEQALRWNEDYCRLAQELHTAAPDHLDFTYCLAAALNNLGWNYEQQDNLPLALNHYRQAQVLLAELVAKSPLHVELKETLDWLNRRLEALDT